MVVMNTQSTFRSDFSRLGKPRQIGDEEKKIFGVVPGIQNPDFTATTTASGASGLAIVSDDLANVFGTEAAGVSDDVPERIATRVSSLGFLPQHPRLHRVYNFLAACVLILIGLPLFVLISTLLFVTQGKSIFYRGVRVGLKGRHFNIIKFRTLDGEQAKELTRDRVLPDDSNIETPLGYFLRETRLDELPQLFNVLQGDMNICGPRPVRPQISAELEGEIPGYSKRFRVKPGLLGPTQAYMNHGTSKRIRARFNAKFLRQPVSYRSELGLIALVGTCVLLRAAARLWSIVIRAFRAAPMDAKAIKRASRFQVGLEASDGTFAAITSLTDDRIVTEHPVAPGSARLHMTLPDGRKRVASVEIDAVSDHGSSNEFGFRASGDYSNHVLTRYFYERVVIPHHSRIAFLSLGRNLRARMVSYMSVFRRQAMPPARA